MRPSISPSLSLSSLPLITSYIQSGHRSSPICRAYIYDRLSDEISKRISLIRTCYEGDGRTMFDGINATTTSFSP